MADAETCSTCGHKFLWRRSFGRKGYNRVTVYERVPDGPLQLLYWGTVSELFTQLHRDRAGEWSKKWQTDQARYRQFWETTLGWSTDITEVTPALVARIVSKEAAAKGWSAKTRNHYLNCAVETWAYAERFLKWIRPEQNLEAVRRH